MRRFFWCFAGGASRDYFVKAAREAASSVNSCQVKVIVKVNH